jgi:eukaryotic-like serine/threonine-protein kinase
MAIKPGQTVGDYEVVDLIESSKNGVTYKVRNALLQRWEALRVLPRALQDDQEKATRFLREAKVHARINHPNIVSFYHATQLAGQLVMTTELVEGSTLADRMELGPIPLPEALSYASQVLAALAHAHASGIVHRDITPSNIILTAGGGVKLTGFGLAKTVTDPQLTQPGTVIGSLEYISPEQIRGVTELDGRCDIYSLGVVLYEVVTGRKPFEQKSQFEIMLAHVNTTPPAPGVVNPAVPAELSEIILTAMAKDPAARFQTADVFKQRLDQVRGVATPAPAPAPQSEPAAPAAAEIEETPAPPSTLPKGDFWRLIAAGVFTFLVVVLTFYVVMR